MPEVLQYKDPVRNVNKEYLDGLEVLSSKVFALPGAKCRGGDRDPRFSHLAPGTAEAVLFDHLATIRHKDSGMIFVAFRQTLDALHLEQSSVIKYPKWLMDSDVKKTELSTYIHSVKSPYNKNPSAVLNDRSITDTTAQTRVDKWLQEIITPWVFDTVAFFLLKNHIITEEMYGKMK
jgi:hypothetical protein